MAPPTINDNPAQRLFDILLHVSTIANTNANTTARAVWANVLDVKQDDEAVLLEKLAKVYALPKACLKNLEEIGFGIRPHVGWVNTLSLGFTNQNLGVAISGFKNILDANLMEKIESCAQTLSLKAPNIGETEDELQQIVNELNDKIVEIQEGNFSDVIKAFLIKSFEKIIATIREFKIVGTGAVLEEIERLIGKVALNPELKAEFKNNENAFGMFWKVLEKIAAVTGACSAIPLLASASEKAQPFLELIS